MVRNQNFNLRWPILLFIAAVYAAPNIVSKAQKDGIVGRYTQSGKQDRLDRSTVSRN